VLCRKRAQLWHSNQMAWHRKLGMLASRAKITRAQPVGDRGKSWEMPFGKGYSTPVSLFWHALDIIWVVLFTVVYLFGIQQ
jgi:heme/copper-type cytochrome/quinol oxidase subunit 3